MNWFGKALTWLAGVKNAAGQTYTTTSGELAKWFGSSTYAGKNVDATTAMQVTAVWGCVRTIAETVGGLPWAIYRRQGENAERADDHPLAEIFRSPNSDMDETEFFEALPTNVALCGNFAALKNLRGDKNVSSLYPIAWHNVRPKRRDDGTVFYSVNDRGKWEDYPQEKIWHVKGFGSDGLVGYSPIGYNRQAIGTALAQEEFQGRFFSQGARPSLVARIPQWLEKDQREIARENLNKLWAGIENAHRVQLLEGGIDVTPVQMPLQDAQFLQLRGFSVEEICRIFRVPPHMIAKLDRSTNNNIEQQSLEFAMHCIRPYLRRIETSVGKWLFKDGDRGKYFLRFNLEGLLRADAVARSQLYSALLQNGVFSRNEVRALENRNRVDGLDDYTIQTSMAPIDKLTALLAAQIAATKPASSEPGAKGVEVHTHLPESVAMEHKVSVDISEVARILEEQGSHFSKLVAKLDERFDASLIKQDLAFQKMFTEFLAEQRRPRKAIFDKNGEIVGSVAVDSLETKH